MNCKDILLVLLSWETNYIQLCELANHKRTTVCFFYSLSKPSKKKKERKENVQKQEQPLKAQSTSIGLYEQCDNSAFRHHCSRKSCKESGLARRSKGFFPRVSFRIVIWPSFRSTSSSRASIFIFNA